MKRHSLSENKVLKILSGVAVVTCAAFYFLGLKLDSFDTQLLFGFFFLSYSICFIGFQFKKTHVFKPIYLLLVTSGVFSINELLGEHAKMFMMYPMELGFIFVFYKNSPKLRWVFLLIISLFFLVSTNGGNIIFEAITMPESYAFFSDQLLSLISLGCLWLTLEFNQKNILVIEERNQESKIDFENHKLELNTIKNLITAPLEDLISIGEVIPYSRNPEEMADYLKIWNEANAKVHRLMKSIDELGSSSRIENKGKWKNRDLNQFCLEVEERLTKLGLSKKIEYKVDEALYHKSKALPQELLEQWVLDIVIATSEIPRFDFDELLALDIYKENNELVFDLKTLFEESEEICVENYGVHISNISDLVSLETKNLGIVFEFSFHQNCRRFVFKFPIVNAIESGYGIGYSEGGPKTKFNENSKVILVCADKVKAEISKRRFDLVGVEVVTFNSLFDLDSSDLEGEYCAVICDVKQLNQDCLDWAYRARHHSSKVFSEINILLWVESIGNVNTERLKQIPLLSIHRKPSSIDELVKLIR